MTRLALSGSSQRLVVVFFLSLSSRFYTTLYFFIYQTEINSVWIRPLSSRVSKSAMFLVITKECPANPPPPPSDAHVHKTQPSTWAGVAWRMLGPISKQPWTFHFIKHCNPHSKEPHNQRSICGEHLNVIKKAEKEANLSILTAIWCQSRPETAAEPWAHREAGHESYSSWLDCSSRLHKTKRTKQRWASRFRLRTQRSWHGLFF